ncbi:MAG TPA: HAMP domain-containing sensor histidine kinase, partial [Terrimicrobiaceae bacterium]|nr:HAMP domain-containing sensor histidine kinase [Terrimicrobiaceae bacterium]
LVNNVLDFSRMERGQRPRTSMPLDARPVIARIWEAESVRLREAGFATEWQCDDGPFPVESSEDAIAQILVNLLSNAEKYHGPRKEILLISRRREETLEISVCDRGTGVPRGLEAKIFDAFFRADDSLSSDVPGSGLGLTLARRAAREVGGDITCGPRPGGGSIFTLHLPLIP